MKTSAIIPVKSFSKAKTRLDVPDEKRIQLCKIMYEEVLNTITNSSLIDNVIVVSKDESALQLCKQYDAIPIIDDKEISVNNAVSLADDYLKTIDCDASVVFPQDIPLIQTKDIDFLLHFQKPPKFALVVPSRKFDGTNALVRAPVDLMETHYDEDSYKIHLETGKKNTPNTSLVFVNRIMIDVDTSDDLDFVLKSNEKPELRKKIQDLF